VGRVLTALGASVPRAASNDRPTGAATADVVGVVSVRIGAQEFAVDIASVREIRGWTAPTPLPCAPAHVRGCIDLRGVIIPIIDLGARLGFGDTQADPSSVVVVVEIRDRLAGLLADGVCDLIDLDASRLQATPQTGSLEPNQVVRAVFEIDGRILGLISLDNIVPAELADQAAVAS
jgi:purine-binding chemotaxis protein CheW